MSPVLKGWYERAHWLGVVRAEGTPHSAGASSMVQDLQVLEVFKGPITEDRFSVPLGSMCSPHFDAQQRYLISVSEKGTASLCSVHALDTRPGGQARADILRAYVSGQLPHLVEPWVFSEAPKYCHLAHEIPDADNQSISPSLKWSYNAHNDKLSLVVHSAHPMRFDGWSLSLAIGAYHERQAIPGTKFITQSTNVTFAEDIAMKMLSALTPGGTVTVTVHYKGERLNAGETLSHALTSENLWLDGAVTQFQACMARKRSDVRGGVGDP